MRICIVYDCLYPWTVGGGEHWYRNLAAEFADDGHEVTYLTRLQWDSDDPPDIKGVEVIAVSRRDVLYGADGNRRIGPPMRFGWGVLKHLLRHRGRYDVIHCAAFPFFSLVAARIAIAGTGARLGVDWFEVWSRAYWRSYLGRLGGAVGYLVQRLCVVISPGAFVFSRMHAQRLKQEGLRREPVTLAGLYTGPTDPQPSPDQREPVVVFAGRHIAEKRVPSIPAVIAAARAQIPGLRAKVFGDGPQRPALLREIERLGVADIVEAPGFVDHALIDDALREATCLLLPSSREGYGLVVIEAASVGTPSVVVEGEDNAAIELIADGVNGHVAASASTRDVAAAIIAVHEEGEELRRRTEAWFAQAAPTLTAAASARTVLEIYTRR